MTGRADTSVVLEGLTEPQMAVLGETIAAALTRGDMVWLQGDLGAGKTALARAIIRSAYGAPETDVPSPTFSLVQHYDTLPFGELAHGDLYRLDEQADVHDLAFDDALAEGVALVEWPRRAGRGLPEPLLTIRIEIDDEATRTVTLTGEALPRIRRSLAIRRFLDLNGMAEATRQHLTGDASARSYETVTSAKRTLILMNAPATADGPPVAPYGVPYSQVAHLAEDIRAFVAIDKALAAAGFVVPQIEAADLDAGLLLISDLGSEQIVTQAREPVAQRYEAAVDCLIGLHGRQWATVLPVADGEPLHHVPAYSKRAMLAEVDLLPQWYAPRRMGQALEADEITRFQAIWSALVDRLESSETSLVLRDFHSPNIIWQEEAAGTDRVGLIDFQDAVIGPTAYDLASLAQDARIDVPEALEAALVNRYVRQRLVRDAGFDETAFRADYAIMAAQRATKIAGIFVRLSQRDGKHGYVQHLPRIEAYLGRSLNHPVLAAYAAWWREVFGP